MKKKILFIWRNLEMGGAEVALIRLVQNFKKDHEVSILCFENKKESSFVINVPVFYSSIATNNVFFKTWNKIKFCIYILKHVINNNVIIINEAPFLAVYSWFLKRYLFKKIIVWIHVDILFYTYKMNSVKKALFRFALRRLDKVVCVSNISKGSMIKFLGQLSHNIIKIYNSLEKQYCDNSIEDNIKKDNRQIIFMGMGRLVPEKGFDVLIKAFAKVRTHIDCILYIYGEGSSYAELEQLIKKLRLESVVKLMGKTNYPLKSISKCDIFISPSYSESFSLVTLEALLCEKPVIVSETGAVEIIENGKYGEIFAIGDINMLADKMLTLGLNKELRQKYTESSKLALAKFDNQLVLNEWNKIIQN